MLFNILVTKHLYWSMHISKGLRLHAFKDTARRVLSFFSLLIALFCCLKWGLPVYARLTLNSLYSSRQPIPQILLPQLPYRTWLIWYHQEIKGPLPLVLLTLSTEWERMFLHGLDLLCDTLYLTYFYFMRMSVFATCLYGHHLCAWCSGK